MLDACGVNRTQLSPLGDEPILLSDASAPALRGAKWYPAIGDGAASNLGSGATKPGFAAINVGTSAAVRVMASGATATSPFGLFAYRVDAKRFLVGGAISNAGNLREWCLRTLAISDTPTALEERLAERPGPSMHGLTVLPFWAAERAPSWNEDAQGAIHGLTLSTTPLDILQAVVESTYHRIALIADLVDERSAGGVKMIVSGGICKSRGALQRLADVMGRPLHPNEEPEASLRGAAAFALERLGRPSPAQGLASPIRPRPRYACEYAADRKRQVALERVLRVL